MSDLAVNVAWQEIIKETESGNIPHCRAIAVKSKFHNEIIESLAKIILGNYRINHPDLIIIGNIDKPPVIDSCRWFIEEISLKPMESKMKFGVVMCADKINLNAANSLLKLAEEPPEHAVLLFLMEDSRLFLPTLKSRSRLTNIIINEEKISTKIPVNDSEWIKWLADSRKKDSDSLIQEITEWANFAVDNKDFMKSEKIEKLRIIAENKNLSVPMLCDLIILILKGDNTINEYILDNFW